MSQSIRESPVSVKGTIQNATAQGLTPINAVSEKVDNPLDYGAQNIQIEMYELNEAKWLIISSDCEGMTLEELRDSGYMNNRKSGSNTKNGLMGVGNTASEIVLTEHQFHSLTISKKVDGELIQTIRDYPTAIKEDRMHLIATEISRKNEEKWDRHTINKEHGVVCILQITNNIYNQLQGSWDQMMYDFRKMYALYIQNGVTLRFILNGKYTVITQNNSQDKEQNIVSPFVIHTAVAAKNILNYSCHREPTVNIEVWRKPNTNEAFLRYKDKKGEYHTSNGTNPTPPPEFEQLDDILYDISFDDSTYKQEDGGFHILRNQKVLYIHKAQPMNTDDMYKRKVHTNCRESIKTNSNHDFVLNLLVNKSRIVYENINADLLSICKELKKKFRDRLNDRKKKAATSPPKTPPKIIVKQSPVAAVTTGGGAAANPQVPSNASVLSSPKNVIVPHRTPTDNTTNMNASAQETNAVTIPRKIVVKSTSPSPSKSVVQIPAHTRTLSKSPLDIVMNLERLRDAIVGIDFDTLKRNVSNIAQPGLVDQYNATENILQYLNTHVHNQKN